MTARQRLARRAKLEAAIEVAIAALDALDGDVDMEPAPDDEAEPAEASDQPWSLECWLFQAGLQSPWAPEVRA